MTVRIRIDNREIAVEPGTSILRAASEAGVYIPHLCYNKHLSIKGSCRICLVEVEGNPKLQPACSTVVCDRMVVKTDSPPVLDARKGVLELLLINHPIDCPVCDKGGECKLQDYVFRYGAGKGRFRFDKRTFAGEDLGPFVVRDMNRCIHCTRCVRFTSEITLTEDLGVFDRGDSTSIGTYLGRELRNSFSGNVTELCPVGALTDRVFRFKARIWELEEVSSACPLCPVGCLTRLQLDKGRIVRVLSRKDGVAPWICDLGRFGFAGAGSGERKPVIKENGRDISVPWEVGLRTVGGRFRAISKESGPQSMGVLCSASATNEEIFALQHVFRNTLACDNVYFRPRAAAPASIEEAQVLWHALRSQGRADRFTGCDSILLFCADPCEETPIAGLDILRAVGSDARVTAIGPRKPRPDTFSDAWLASTPHDSVFVLASIAREIVRSAEVGLALGSRCGEILEELNGFSLEKCSELTGIGQQRLRSLADEVLSSRKLGLVVGREVFNDRLLDLVLSSIMRIRAVRAAMAERETVLFSLLGEANVRGALELGVFPALYVDGEPQFAGEALPMRGERPAAGERPPTSERPAEKPATGKSFAEMVEAARSGRLKALFVFGGDPLSEFESRKAMQEALANIEFLVVQNEIINETARMAHVYLPLQNAFEREGSFLTLDGDLKALRPEISFYGSRSLVFDVLDSLCNGTESNSDFKDADSVLREMKRVYGWSFTQDLKGLSSGHGVRLYDSPEAPSQAWIVPREFEKRMATEIEEKTRVKRAGDADRRSRDYPYVLISGLAGVSSWIWARDISRHQSIPRSGFAEISELDAEKLGITNGSTIEIESPAGSVMVRAVLTENLMRGVVFLPYGFADATANVLSETGEPVTRVRLKKVRA